jgi:hypothetical protein
MHGTSCVMVGSNISGVQFWVALPKSLFNKTSGNLILVLKRNKTKPLIVAADHSVRSV